jgi:hypothetical protein
VSWSRDKTWSQGNNRWFILYIAKDWGIMSYN